MKPNGSFGQQLALQELILLPGGEWTPRLPGWTVLRINRGAGYWLQTQLHRDLTEGSVLVLSRQAEGLIRASQLGEMSLQFFFVQPESLSGIVTLQEQNVLREAPQKGDFAVRLLSAGESIALDFKRLASEAGGAGPRARLQRLELFIRVFERDFAATTNEPALDAGAKARLELLIRRLAPADLLELDFSELAAQVGCSPRHLGRIFQEVIGVSFRQKQSEVRLGRAKQLLANGRPKIIEVALESGYQSLSLFNLMFKRHFGLTPSQWRTQHVRRGALRNVRM
jgi:AraC-like DNA-binding protein